MRSGDCIGAWSIARADTSELSQSKASRIIAQYHARRWSNQPEGAFAAVNLGVFDAV